MSKQNSQADAIQDNELRSSNLFKYATKELSQDAFICWLLSFAMDENLNIDNALTDCANDILKKIFWDKYKSQPGKTKVTKIYRQYKDIDVLIEVNDEYYIVIEDKTFSGEHDNQISRYVKIVEDNFKAIYKNNNNDNIITVYYKIVEQSEATNADCPIYRKDILEIFKHHESKISNQIFRDYFDYLQWIDAETRNWSKKPISEWTEYNYRGFFSELGHGGWRYVSNPAGGFWCLWWYWRNKDVLQKRYGIFRIKSIYLQIENRILALKLETDDDLPEEEIKEFRRNLYNNMEEELAKKGINYEKKRFRTGKSMSVGYIDYDETNYADKMKVMEDAIESVLENMATS